MDFLESSLGLAGKYPPFECSFKPMLILYDLSILAKENDLDWSPYDFTKWEWPGIHIVWRVFLCTLRCPSVVFHYMVQNYV